MKTSRTLSFTAAALITSLQLGAIAAAFSIAPIVSDSSFEQAQTTPTYSSLAPVIVVATPTD
jgi:hypothetical protein